MKTLKRETLLLVIVLFATIVISPLKADLCSSNHWSQTWSESYSNGGFSWTVTNTSPSWLITDTNNYATWILSVKGTTGDYDFILMAAASSTNGEPDLNAGYIDRGIGRVITSIARQDVINLFPTNDHAYFVVLAKRTSGSTNNIAGATAHGVGTSLAQTNLLAADNYGTTFYAGSGESQPGFDGVGDFVGKCNNGVWIDMGLGVDCNNCPNPQVNSLSVGGTNGSVVTVQGVFDFGYNASAPFEVDCTTSGLLYWHNDSSTTGHWSTSP